ncbi:hypothetical protein HPB48_011601 [Haemaphysalis longicornis]|uniref:Uncharacterized protein n=1 Tax=Haemaphysalis longicornis TaxID=44386 RepID=A0A9J6FY46_HAELO|nr:hypothetical protein HPB48_011601 [Haemaphysalis longicornis]
MNIHVMLEGTKISPTCNIKIPTMTYQEDCKKTQLMWKLGSSTTEIMRMFRRIARQKLGMEEQDMLSLVSAFIISRIHHHFISLGHAQSPPTPLSRPQKGVRSTPFCERSLDKRSDFQQALLLIA